MSTQAQLTGPLADGLRTALAGYDNQRVFLVTGRSSFESCGAAAAVGSVFTEDQYVRFSAFEVNPRLEDIEAGLQLFRQSGAGVVVCIGGGSALDVGKAIAMLAAQELPAEACVTGAATLSPRRVPLVAAPTTAGTGSEATHFSVVYVRKTKFSFAHPSMLPDCAILDSALTARLPAHITASSGFDALAQAIESFWSVGSTPASRQWSLAACELCVTHLPAAVKGGDAEARARMLHASHLAGKAINVAKTTAAHAASYPITSYFGVPHGHAVALTLPYFVEFNAKVSQDNLNDERGLAFVAARMEELLGALNVRSGSAGKDKLHQLMDHVGLERRLHRLGINSTDHAFLLTHGFNPARVKNNPRRVDREDLAVILRSAQ